MSGRPTLVMDSWSCPTWVRSGVSAGSALAQMCQSRQIVLVTDARFDPARSPLRECLEGVKVRAHGCREPGISDWDFLQETHVLLAANPGALPVAVGGGSVLDAVRLAALASGTPALFSRLAGVLAGGGGMLALPGTPRSAVDLVSLPTTIGTAAEVSPLAVVRAGAGGAAMVVTPELRGRAAIHDPELTAGLTHAQLTLGLLEPFARAVVPAICGNALPLQDSLTRALGDTVTQLAEQLAPHPGDQPGGQAVQPSDGQLRRTHDWAQWRLTAAQLSAQTHTSFLAVGRSPFGTRLWPVATELTGPDLSKAEAMAWLIPAWLRGLASGALGKAWGNEARAEAVLGQAVGPAAARIAGWLRAAGLQPPAEIRDPAQVAAAVCTRWPMFLGPQNDAGTTVAPAELVWLAAQVGAATNE